MPLSRSNPNRPLAPLSPAQLELYLQHVSSGTLTVSSLLEAMSSPSGTLNVLTTLIRLHMRGIPWGSLSAHYSLVTLDSLKAEDVFQKLVVRKLAGHCLEIVPLFASVLRALGYSLYFTGARIGPAMTAEEIGGEGAGFHAWSHLVLIVTIDDRKYVVDPQYLQITQPVLLNPAGPEIIFDSIPDSLVRLRYAPLAELVPNHASNSGLMTWVFDVKFTQSEETWKGAYIFSTESEWFIEDLSIMNVWLAKAEESYMLSSFMLKRLLLADEGGPWEHDKPETTVATLGGEGSLQVPKLAGYVQLVDDRFTVRRFTQLVIDQKVNTEQERLEVMQKWFGIELQKEEKEAIWDRRTALPREVY